ncbi:MAG: hypothetical protein A3F31_00500 [Candidatus Levybacteria bacterium RIFCSPHIGHO2_12_FULL_38_12]|nr:MAG: hypothetical protein A3F31_00500 [Candidatus Levybacteria bacterium RIFCSPHIGHO2_12_FULL_38_12]
MQKSITSFVCNECGYESAQYLGKCPECGEWNSLKEFKISNSKFPISNKGQKEKVQPKKLSEVHYEEKERVSTGFLEMDTVLGGGIVKGSVTLIAGDPGIGKSTLLLQLALFVSNSKVVLSKAKDPKHQQSTQPKEILRSAQNDNKRTVLYISGEESEDQIKLRAQRITTSSNTNLLLLSINNTDAIVEVIESTKPSLVIIDSIQTVDSEALEGLAGSVGQVRYAASTFTRVAKSLHIPVFIVGHVTKEGMVAGPMVLSHMVDTVLLLEGERFTKTRILRSLKNRFGPIDEVGIFAMEEAGMIEVKNPESIFLSQKREHVPGSVLVATLEGTRAFLVELQSLVVYSKFPMPKRVASGIDPRRLELLLAVLQKHCKLPVETMDVFVNVPGGLKLSDPAIDLGICLAVFSSLKNVALENTVGIAEVGLLGELRKVSALDKRVKQAEKLGFKNIISSESHKSLSQVMSSLSK